jgi:hypothetical protein
MAIAQNSKAPTSQVEPPFVPELTISPNPAKDYINITQKSSVYKRRELSIYNVNGKRIKHYQGQTNKLNISDLKTGIYLIHIVWENNTSVTRKIVKL